MHSTFCVSSTRPRSSSWDSNSGKRCARCLENFTLFHRRHHCRNCGALVCHDCSSHREALPQKGYVDPVRVCDQCSTRSGQRIGSKFTSSQRPRLSSSSGPLRPSSDEGVMKKRTESNLIKKVCSNCSQIFLASSCLEEFCSVDCRSNHLFFFAEQSKKTHTAQFPKLNDIFTFK